MTDVHAQSVEDLDFLPLKYRQNQTGHRATARWLLAIVLCAAVLASVSWIQYRASVQLDVEMADVGKQHQHAVAQTQMLAALEAGKRKLDDEAALYTYLRHPWPRTTLLATIASAMPESIILTELQVTRTQPAARGPVRRRSNTRSADKSLEETPNDLTQLRAAYDETQVHVSIEGLTQDVAQLHSRFIGPLDGSPLFETSTLQFVKRDDSIRGDVSRFRVELVVRQGYGQPQGLSAVAQIAELRRVDLNELRQKVRPATAFQIDGQEIAAWKK